MFMHVCVHVLHTHIHKWYVKNLPLNYSRKLIHRCSSRKNLENRVKSRKPHFFIVDLLAFLDINVIIINQMYHPTMIKSANFHLKILEE